MAKQDPKKNTEAPKGKEVSEAAKAAEEAKKKAKEAAEQLKKEKEAAAEAKKKQAEEAKAAKEKEKEEAAAQRAAEKAERDRLKGGPGKLLRSLIARIKYMGYMDNPSSTLEGIEALTWTLALVTSEGTAITVERGTNLGEASITIKQQGKKAEVSTVAIEDEALKEFFANVKP